MPQFTRVLRHVGVIAAMAATASGLAAASEDKLVRADALFEEGLGKLKTGEGKEAISLFKEACLLEAGERATAFSCDGIFAYYRDGTTGFKGEADSVKTNPNLPSYLNFSQAACEAGYKPGCYNNLKYARSGETEQDYHIQANYLEKLCKLDEVAACEEHGHLWAGGKMGKPNLSLARKSFREGCDRGGHASCAAYRDYLADGIGGAEDLPAAFDANLASCPAENPYNDELCLDAADFALTEGDDTDAENAQILGFLERACDFANAEACAWYAEELEYSESPQDILKAKEIRLRACRYGDKESCDG